MKPQKNKKLSTALRRLIVLSLLVSPVARGEEQVCEDTFAHLGGSLKLSKEQLLARMQDTNYPGWKKIIHNARDSTRRFLQRKHKHNYPVIALDDATPVNAYALAQDAFGALREEQKSLVNIDEIKKNLDLLIQQAENYPKTLQAHMDETTTLVAQEKIIREYLEKASRSSSIDLKLPVVTTNADGTLKITQVERSFGNDIMLQNHLDDIVKKIKARSQSKFLGFNETENLALSQGITIKRLETFMSEIKSARKIHADKEMPEELANTLSRIEALFADPSKAKLKDELAPPNWAWNRIRWMQLHGEVRSIVEKDIPALVDKEENKKIIAFLNNMTEEEREILGFRNVAAAANILKKTKWLVAVPTALGTGGGITGAVTAGYNFLISNAKKKEYCAGRENESEFQECVQEYLQEKFSAEAIAAIFSNRAAFLDPKGHIKDGAILEEVLDIFKRKERITAHRNFEKNARTSLSSAIAQLMGNHDRASEKYREKLVQIPTDEAFIAVLLGDKDKDIPSYLEFHYPVFFRQHKDLIVKTIKAENNSDTRNKGLEELNEKAKDLADMISSLLNDRETFKTNGTYNNSSSNDTEEEDSEENNEEPAPMPERPRR